MGKGFSLREGTTFKKYVFTAENCAKIGKKCWVYFAEFMGIKHLKG